MSSLGVVAGFMTHEASSILATLKDAMKELKRVAAKHPSLTRTLERLEKSYAAFQAHVSYTRTFIDAQQEGIYTPFKAAAQIKVIIKHFGTFATERGIAVNCEINNELEAPAMPVTVYSGIVLNLYTNALKAILAAETANSLLVSFFEVGIM